MFVMNIWFGLPLLVLAILSRLNSLSARKTGRFIGYNFAKSFAKMFSKFSRYYCLIEFLPKYAEDVTPCSLKTDTKPNEYAIVLQGPVLDGFTAETIRIYRKIFPKAVIIVSTWKSTDSELVAELRSLADEVILSDLPSTSGLLNIHYQTKSSYEGSKKAYELGIPYSMKTRTDQRILQPMIFEYFKSLFELFPLDNEFLDVQKERIITASGGGIARPYFINDFFYFGTSYDMMKFFDFPPDNMDNEIAASLARLRTRKKNFRGIRIAPEAHIIKSYVYRTSKRPNECEATVKRFWEDLRKRFLIISRSELKLWSGKDGGKYDNKYVNFSSASYTDSGQPESDEAMPFTNQLFLSLLKGHLLYEERFDEYQKEVIEVFPELGKFCKGYEHLEEVMSAIPILRGEIKN